jgi:hypothetical protein
MRHSKTISAFRACTRLSGLAVLMALAVLGMGAQEPAAEVTRIESAPVVPQQVRFTGTLPNRPGDTVEAVFRIYAAPEGGKPLWAETQTISVASDGTYAVLLGAVSSKGLPQAVFSDGQARWVGISVERGDEEPRIPLASTPYAMKAGDAQTLGGLSAQSYVTHAQLAAVAQSLAAQAVAQIAPSVTAPTGSGTTDYLPLWTSASNLGNSILYQVNLGPGNSIGVGTTAPSARVHIVGTGGTIPSLVVQGGGGLGVIKIGGDVNANTLTPSVRKLARITMPDWAADSLGVTLFSGDVTAANANDLYFGGTPGGSQYAATGLHFVTAANGTTTGGAEQATLTSAGNFGIGTTAPAAKLEVNGTAKFDGNITFASTQTFPVKGTGGGTITGITTTSPLTGSGTSGSVALALNTTALETNLNNVYPRLNAENSFTATQTISGTLKATGAGFPFQGTPNGGAVAIGGTMANGGDSLSGTDGAGVTGYGGGSADSGSIYGGDGGDFYGGTGGSAGGIGVYAVGGPDRNDASSDWAAYFEGNTFTFGSAQSSSASLTIDHPQDPANKIFQHASVESSEMMNIYTGNVVTDQNGNALVKLPEWFESLNADFRYQLTVIGKFAQAIVSKEIANHEFSISTNATFTKVSWQVTAVRHDAYALAHPLEVEKDKPAFERGYYLHPELYGQPAEKSVAARHHPGSRRPAAPRTAALHGTLPVNAAPTEPAH